MVCYADRKVAKRISVAIAKESQGFSVFRELPMALIDQLLMDSLQVGEVMAAL